MFAARTAIAGSRMRSAKSSMSIVSSFELNSMSTPFCVATCRVVDCSTVFCTDSDAPERTVYWLGRRTFSESPIFAPEVANESSYWRLMVPMKFSF